jgi:AraC-like DNA-binding protein
VKAVQLMSKRSSEEDLTLDVIAEAVSTSPRRLQQIFTEHGDSFSNILRAARIEQAVELVVRGPQRTGIGRKVGYRHENHFARTFERSVGVTPSILRRAVIAYDRYERTRTRPPPESARSLRALKRRMCDDAALVEHVCGQLIRTARDSAWPDGATPGRR